MVACINETLVCGSLINYTTENSPKEKLQEASKATACCHLSGVADSHVDRDLRQAEGDGGNVVTTGKLFLRSLLSSIHLLFTPTIYTAV